MGEDNEDQIEKLNRHIDSTVEEKIETRLDDIESRVIEMGAVHTQDRHSPWKQGEYDVGNGKAFQRFLEASFQSWDKYGRSDRASEFIEDKTYCERFLGNTSGGGSNVVPEVLAEDVIPLLYKRLVLFQAGAMEIPMPHKKLPVGRQNARATASYQTEGTTLTDDGPEFNQLTLDAEKCTAYSEVANDWLRADPRASTEFVANDLMNAFTQRMEEAILHGDGANKPEGLISQMDTSNVIEFTADAGTTSSLTDFEAKLDDAEKQVLDSNVRPQNIAVMIGDRDYLFLRRQRDSGRRIFPGLREDPTTLVQKRAYRTNLIEEDKDVSTDGDNDESAIYVGDFSAILVGILTDMELSWSEHNKFADDLTSAKLIGHHDSKLRQTDHVAALVTDISA